VTAVLYAGRNLTSNAWTTFEKKVLPGCPANTYESDTSCAQCPANATSPANSFAQQACQCDANFYLQVPSPLSPAPCPEAGS
jgi:hypothetical protein